MGFEEPRFTVQQLHEEVEEAIKNNNSVKKKKLLEWIEENTDMFEGCDYSIELYYIDPDDLKEKIEELMGK